MLFVVVFLLILIFNTLHGLPNIIFLIADDLGWNDVGYHGATNAYTPSIDSLLQESFEFNRFYVNPKCSPTRAAFMTGRYAHKNSMQHEVGLTERMACGIDPSSKNVFWSQRISTCSSYSNYFVGKWHLGFYQWQHTPLFRGFDSFKGFYRGEIDYETFTFLDVTDWQDDFNSIPFDELDPVEVYSTDVFADHSISILRNIANTNNDSPFTLTISFNAPHAPIHSIQPSKSIIKQSKLFASMGDTARINYLSMVHAMDKRIGDIIFTLKNEKINGIPIWDNSWVWFFSDNGPVVQLDGSAYPLRGAKSTLFEGGVRVPAFITGGLLPNELVNTATDELIHVTDIYKTLCTQTNSICSSLSLDGKDLTKLISNTGDYRGEQREMILNVDEYDCNSFYNGSLVCGGIIKKINNKIYKAIIGNQIIGLTSKKYGWTELNTQIMQDLATIDCITNAPDWNQHIITDCGVNNRVCLFDLSSDPCEHNDLSQNIEFQNILIELMTKLIRAFNNQPTPFFTDCDTPETSLETAISFDSWMPWAEFYDNPDTNAPPPDTFKLINTFPYQDTCN